MTLDQFFNVFTLFSQTLLIFKLFLIVLAFFYLIFSIVVYRQISLMTQTLNSSVSPLIRTAALVQIGAVAFLLVLVIILA